MSCYLLRVLLEVLFKSLFSPITRFDVVFCIIHLDFYQALKLYLDFDFTPYIFFGSTKIVEVFALEFVSALAKLALGRSVENRVTR